MFSRKKNESGDRGSFDEEDRSSKKSNMASNSKEVLEDDPNTSDDDQTEPSLFKIKELLIDIQISIELLSLPITKPSKRKLTISKARELQRRRASLKETKNKAVKYSLASLNTRLTAADKELQKQSVE